MITELLEKNGRVVGAVGIPRDEDKTIIFRAGAVVLCTGAGTFKSPGWPASPNAFDKHMMAYKLGAQIVGKEWNDFHGTNPTTPGDCFGNHGGALVAPLSPETDPTLHSLRHFFWSAYDGVSADSSGGDPSAGTEGNSPGEGRGNSKGPGASGGPGRRIQVLGAALEAALTNVNYLKEHFVPRLIAKNPHELRLALEKENIIINAEMKLRASMFRKESRHSHFREDFPYRDDKNWLSFVILQKDSKRGGLSTAP